MAYLTATRYGLTHIEPTEQQHASGWRQIWEHPSGLLAMRDPAAGYWVIGVPADGVLTIPDTGWCSSLRGAARKIERLVNQSSEQSTNAPDSAASRATVERAATAPSRKGRDGPR